MNAIAALRRRNPLPDPVELDTFAALARDIMPAVLALHKAPGRSTQDAATSALRWLKDDFTIVLHRDSRNLSPENTVGGAKASIGFIKERFRTLLGYEPLLGQEVDGQLTADKKLAVHHDECPHPDLVRIASKKYNNPYFPFKNLYIKHMTMAFIQKHLRVGDTKLGSKTNIVFDNQIQCDLEPVPELSDFKDLHPEVPMYAENKYSADLPHTTGTREEIVEAMKPYEAQFKKTGKDFRPIAFDAPSVAMMVEAFPDRKVGLLMDRSTIKPGSRWLGEAGAYHAKQSPVDLVAATGAKIWLPEQSMLVGPKVDKAEARKLMQEARAKNIPVIPYSDIDIQPETPKTAAAILELGCSGADVDNPLQMGYMVAALKHALEQAQKAEN